MVPKWNCWSTLCRACLLQALDAVSAHETGVPKDVRLVGSRKGSA